MSDLIEKDLRHYNYESAYRAITQRAIDEFDEIDGPEKNYHINVCLNYDPLNASVFVRDFRDSDVEKTKTWYRFETEGTTMVLTEINYIDEERKGVIDRFNQNLANKFGLTLEK